jgi:hypothetical protein
MDKGKLRSSVIIGGVVGAISFVALHYLLQWFITSDSLGATCFKSGAPLIGGIIIAFLLSAAVYAKL